ncbi:MAG TPA: cistern family PEP-CTERM protein [Coleofasciculaceae cyanobacterium]
MKTASRTALLPAIFGAASIALASSLFSAPANAYTVNLNGRIAGDPGGALYDVGVDSDNDIGRALDPITWLVPAGTQGDTGILPYDISAQANITLKNLTSDLLELVITLTNTTVAGPDRQASIVSFGFGVSPDATGVQISQEGNIVFDQAIIQNGQQQFPGGFKRIDVCIYGANNCSGGNVNQGLQIGQSDTFTLKISGKFGTNPSAVTISDFPLKFQTNYGSFEPAGIPEPLTVAGSGLALGIGALLKKQSAKRSSKEVVKS